MGFTRFNLSKHLLDSLTALGYAEPTPIQARAIPEVLLGHDLQACAQTGTGKTCAFVLPILEKLLKSHRAHAPKVLILVPTRELAAQVESVVISLAKHTQIDTALILGGANMNHQTRKLRTGPEVIVATPGRLMDHLERRSVSLAQVTTLVLDEADRMLDMGFLPTIRRIVQQLPQNRQTLLFSATFGHDIQNIVKQFLKNPVVIEIARSQPSQNVTQMAYPVPKTQKLALLQALLELHNMTSALIFTRTKHGANRLAQNLGSFGKSVTVIHGNRSQSQRQAALQGFKDRRYQLLVATDIAARGIDVKDISHVINFDVPLHAEDYVHRIGRTGRASAVGEAFTLVSPDEEKEMRDIERLIKKSIPRTVIPDFPYNKKPQMFPRQDSGAQARQNMATPAQNPNQSHQRPQHSQQRPHNPPAHRSFSGGGNQQHRAGSSHGSHQGRPQHSHQRPNNPNQHGRPQQPHQRPHHNPVNSTQNSVPKSQNPNPQNRDERTFKDFLPQGDRPQQQFGRQHHSHMKQPPKPFNPNQQRGHSGKHLPGRHPTGGHRPGRPPQDLQNDFQNSEQKPRNTNPPKFFERFRKKFQPK